MKINYCIPLLSLFVLLMGCTREDMSDCYVQGGLRIMLSDEQGEPALPLKRVDIYLFDADRRFVCSRSDSSLPITTSDVYAFDLPQGSYTAIVWGNVNEALTLTPSPFIEGITTLDEVRLALTNLSAVGITAADVIVPEVVNTELYYSSASEISVPADQFAEVTLPLHRNSKEITITTQFVNADASSCTLHSHTLHSSIRSNDGILSFDNALHVCPEFYYKPATRTTIPGGHSASFQKMRLHIDEPSEIILSYPDATDPSGIFYRKSLMTLLQATGFADQQALDQTHTYNIDLRFECQGDDTTHATVRIFVNGWEYIEMNDDL